MIGTAFDHLVLGVCHLPVVLTLYWITVRGQWLLVNRTVQTCLAVFWTFYVLHHFLVFWPHDPVLDQWSMRLKAIASLPLLLFAWPMFREPETLPDRVEWQRRLGEMSTFVETQKADAVNTRKRIAALARLCRVQLERNREELTRLQIEHANDRILERLCLVNAGCEKMYNEIRAEFNVPETETAETPDAAAVG